MRIGAATPGTGLTTNFSYRNDGQVNAAADTLTFGSTGGTAFGNPGRVGDGDDKGASPYVDLLYLVPIAEGLSAGFSMTFSASGLDSSVRSPFQRFGVTSTDVYELSGVIPPLAPYTGSVEGPGPVIPNAPATRTVTQALVGTQDYVFESQTDLYSLAFGGDLRWQPGGKWFVTAGAGVVLNVVDWDAGYSVTLLNPATGAPAPVSASASGTSLLLGVYGEVGVGYEITEDWSVNSFFRYDATEDLKDSVGGSDFETDLSGWSLGLGLEYRF